MSTDSWNPPLLGNFVQQVDTAPAWLLKGILPADSIVVISGLPKLSRKTWFGFGLAMVLASGKKYSVLEPTEPAGVPCLMIQAEGSRAFTKDRWNKLAAGMNIGLDKLPIWFAHRQNILLDSDAWVGKIKDFVAKNGIKFVCVDPMAAHFTGDENNVQDVQKVMRALLSIRQQGVTVALCHHLTKPQKDYTPDIDAALRGSTAISGAYDVHMGLRIARPNQEHINLTVRAKDFEERYYDVHWRIDSVKAAFELVEADAERGDSLADEIYGKMMPQEEYSRARLKEMMDMSGSAIESALLKLLEENKIQRMGRGYCLTNPTV